MPFDIRSPSKCLLTVWTLEVLLHLVHLPVLGARQQGIEAVAALVADIALAVDVGFLVLEQVGGGGETLAADGTNLRELALLRMTCFMMDGERAEVGE